MQIAKKLGNLFGSTSGSSPEPSLPTGFLMLWQPGTGGNGKLTPYTNDAPPGISIGFHRDALSDSRSVTYFGDGKTFKVFYDVPPAPKPGSEVFAASEMMAKLDPGFDVSDKANALVQGYLNYVAEALNLLYQTPTGGKLINGLLVTKRSIFIGLQIYYLGNSYSGGGDLALVSAANQLLEQLKLDALNGAMMLDLITKTSRRTDELAACTWMADELNLMPLYSLWVQGPQYTDGFLRRFLTFKGGLVTGQVIFDWLKNNDAGAFQFFLKTDATRAVGVRLVDYFKSALIMKLYGRSVPGTSCNAGIQFGVCFNTTDDNDPVRQRPPAIGLGHELVHSYNVAVGAQPGIDVFHFSTLLTELICVGLPPFDTIVAISENLIRADWAGVAGRASVAFDRAVPGPRLVYEAVPEGEVEDRRDRSSCP